MVTSQRSSITDEIKWLWMLVGVVQFILSAAESVSPEVPDTSGVHFVFPTPFCAVEDPTRMYVIPQTTEAINITVTGPASESFYIVPIGGVLRTKLPCLPVQWGNVSNSALNFTSTAEVALYLESSGDTHIVFPVDTLRSRYTIATVTSSELTTSWFTVTSLEKTVAEITLPKYLAKAVEVNGNTYSPGAKFEVLLKDRCETLAVNCDCDLSGVQVRTDNPVVALAGSYDDNNIASAHVIEQVPPEEMWGRKFIFTSHPCFSNEITLTILGESSFTNMRLYLKDSAQDLTFDAAPKLSMQLNASELVAIQANASLLVVMLVSTSDVSDRRHLTFVTLTPLALYHSAVHFLYGSVENSAEVFLNLVLSSVSFDKMLLNKTMVQSPFTGPLTFLWNFFLVRDVRLEHPVSVRTAASNRAALSGTVIRRDNSSVRLYPLGKRATEIYSACAILQRTSGGNGDGLDNDCDGRIDEELLDKLDDDGDNSVDEDTVYSGDVDVTPSPGGGSIWDYYKAREEEESGLSASVISVVISIVVALTAVFCFIGGMLLAEKVREKINPSRVQPIND